MDLLTKRARDLLAEMAGIGEWTHDHCDEDSGGVHRLDREAWDKDAADVVARLDILARIDQMQAKAG
jgi:hypothetical protein